MTDRWEEDLFLTLESVREWLLDPANVDATIEAISDLLRRKHHDYGEENLHLFGEFGILVRSSDKIARLKNLMDKPALVNENRDETWRDLAGYAIQALILRNTTETVDVMDVRIKRLMLGTCPDCGKGIVAQLPVHDNLRAYLKCSENCGFETSVAIHKLGHDFETRRELILELANMPAVKGQK